jgi:hypothetical protein
MKSRNLIFSAVAALMMGGVVLLPAVASAQSRDRSGQRDQRGDRSQRSQSDRGSRNQSNRGSQSNRDSRSSNQWSGGSGVNSHWNEGNSATNNWNQGTSGGSLWSQRDRDRNDNRDQRWDRDDRNRRDPDHDGDNDSRNRRDRRYYNYPSYNSNSRAYYGSGSYYNDPYYGNTYSDSNDWRTIADLAGLLAVIGILDHDDTLTFAGTAGALYSLDRYDQDRYSNDRSCRLRAEYFSHPYFYRNGRRYDRETVNRNGEEYYRFVCRY